MITTERHVWESGADYDQEPSYLAPREYMFAGMKMQYSKNTGEWLDEYGELVCLDPSVHRGGESVLMIKKNIFLNFLSRNNLKLFWTCQADKSIRGDLLSENYPPNWLELSGVYMLNEENIEGSMDLLINGRNT